MFVDPVRSLALAALIVGTGCDGSMHTDADIGAQLSVTQQDGRWVLSHSPNAVAADTSGARRLPSRDFPRNVTDSLQHIGDVAQWDDGYVAILDRMRKSVLILDAEHRPVRTFGRAGNGPGEFVDPIGLATFGDRLVVLDQRPDRPFTAFSRDGSVEATPQLRLAGDWFASAWRRPNSRMESPFQSGPEDWTRRLVGLGPEAFAYRIQDDERAYLMGLEARDPAARVLRFRLPEFAMDTMWHGSGPGYALPTDQLTTMSGQRIHETSARAREKLYADRPIVAAGDGWTALRPPGRHEIEIRRAGGQSSLLAWPPGATAVTEQDRLSAALHSQESANRISDRALAAWRRDGAERREQKLRVIVSTLLSFADTLPELSAAFGSGRCLWLVGTSPSDHYDGTARTLIGLNVVDFATQPTVIRVGRHGSRIRDVSGRGVITSYKDVDDVIRLEWHDFADTLAC
jgi:hypothetical protein